MLTELKIQNFAIIENINIQFQSGFNVLSGETGSGKSVLLKALALLMGDKSTTDTIKNGKPQATVEGAFDLSKREDIKDRLVQTGLTEEENVKKVDDTLIVRRIISADGKNRIYINGMLSTLQQLRDIVYPLIELTGYRAPLIEVTNQHENKSLLSKSYHLDLLDHYLGLQTAKATVKTLFSELAELKDELLSLQVDAQTKAQRLDFITYQRDEIANLELSEGEDEILIQQIAASRNSAKIYEFVERADFALYADEDSALARLHRVLTQGQDIARNDQELAAKLEQLRTAKSLIEESLFSIKAYSQDINADPAELENMEARLSSIRKLQKKYGQSIAEILAKCEELSSEIDSLENSDARIAELEAKVSDIEKKMNSKARELHKKRVSGAATLTTSVEKELADLNMKGLEFSIQVNELENVTTTGISDVEFMIKSSKKDAIRSLAKFASGGELSRILLALKRVVGSSEHPRTYLFDEVDAGVSGVTAEKV